MVLGALRAGEDRVVVRDRDDLGRAHRRAGEHLTVDVTDAADETVGRRVGDQVVERPGDGAGRRSPAARTRRTCRRRPGRPGSPVPYDGPWRDASPLHRVDARRTRRRGARRLRRGRHGSPNRRTAGRPLMHHPARRCAFTSAASSDNSAVATGHRGADLDQHLHDPGVERREHLVVHLHRLDQRDDGPLSDDVDPVRRTRRRSFPATPTTR